MLLIWPGVFDKIMLHLRNRFVIRHNFGMIGAI